jgi:GT2 family glycosyltransferase
MPRSGRAGHWEDLSHDYGDFEFTYRIRQAGYRILIHRSSIVDQSVGDAKYFEILGWHVVSTNHPAARRYLYFRNLFYFWLYLYPKRQPLGFSIWILYRISITLLKILLLENNQGSKIAACFRGALDGARKRVNRAYAQPSAEPH